MTRKDRPGVCDTISLKTSSSIAPAYGGLIESLLRLWRSISLSSLAISAMSAS